MDALRASKELMDGHKLELFFLDLSFIGWNLLSAFTLGIASLFVNPYQAQARCSFYESICPTRH